MKIRRSGSRKFHGWTDVVINKAPKVTWDTNHKELRLEIFHEPDIHQPNVSYDYEFIFKIDEFAAIVASIGSHAIPVMPREIHEAFHSKLSELIKLTACASGHNPVALPPATQPTTTRPDSSVANHPGS